MKDRSFKPLVVALALLVCTFIFILLLPPVTELYLGGPNKYTNMDQVSLKLNVKSKTQRITNSFVQAVAFSFFVNILHGTVSPVIMMMTSTECMQACKFILARLLSICSIRRDLLVGNDMAVSARDKALVQARLATQWRKQQSCAVQNRRPATLPMEGLAWGPKTFDQVLSNLTARSQQMDQQNPSISGAGRAKVVQVASAANLQTRAINNREQERKSEVLLRCTGLNLMNRVDDPVNLIGSFQRPKLTFRHGSF